MFSHLPSNPAYLVSDEGVVKGPSGKILKERLIVGGYRAVVLYSGGATTRKTALIHRLVLETYVGPCPEGMEGCHNDGNPANNRLENLRWDTHESNVQDRNAANEFCKKGHRRAGWTKNGSRRTRRCNVCAREAYHDRKAS